MVKAVHIGNARESASGSHALAFRDHGKERHSSRRISILGSTGTIGLNSLDLIERDRDSYCIEALVAGKNVDLLISQAQRYRPRLAVIADEGSYAYLAEALKDSGVTAAAGPEAVIEAASIPVDWVMVAIVGAAGLAPAWAAIKNSRIIALANKECLVCGAELLLAAAERSGATLLPVDSEHSALFQLLGGQVAKSVEKIVLTASGGPFRCADQATMARARPQEALAHPNWRMGAKISIDSATMMNKGLEIIEAHALFSMPNEAIDVLVHPESILHALVVHHDGSLLGHLGVPDMRVPIAYSLAWPERMVTPVERLNLAHLGRLSFEKPDESRFPSLRLARSALIRGNGATCILNAANEIGVTAFLKERIGFLDIAGMVETTLERVEGHTCTSIEDVLALDSEARRHAEAIVESGACHQLVKRDVSAGDPITMAPSSGAAMSPAIEVQVEERAR